MKKYHREPIKEFIEEMRSKYQMRRLPLTVMQIVKRNIGRDSEKFIDSLIHR